MVDEAPTAAEEAPLTTQEEDDPSWIEDKADDNETPLLPQDTQSVEKSGSIFYYHLCDSRLALIVMNVLSLILYICGFIAAMVSGHITVSGQNTVAMVFNILFTLLILYGVHINNWTIVLVLVLWEVFIVVFGIVGAVAAFKQKDWNQEPGGTQTGTEAFIVISIIWQFLMIYAEVVFVYETKDKRRKEAHEMVADL